MAITISGQNNNDKILASDGVLDQISGFNVVGVMTATTFDVTTKHTANHIDVGSTIQLGNAGIITATTLIGNVTGNINSTSHLLLQISGSEKFRVGNGGQLGIGGANYGTSGQVLTSGGSGSAATWSTITETTINNNAANRIITGEGGTTLNGESNFTYNSTLAQLTTDTSTNNTELLRLQNSHTDGKMTVMGFNTDGLGYSQTRIYGGNDNTGANSQQGDSGAGKFKVTITNPSGTHQEVIYAENDANTASKFVRLSTDGNERLRITSDGKFGFGTSSPDQTVHIHKGSAGSVSSTANTVLTLENSTTNVLQFLNPNNTSAQIRFGDPQDDGAGFIDYSHTSNTMAFGANGPTRMQLDGNGHLGIDVASVNQLANSKMLTLRPTDGDGIRFVRPGDGNDIPNVHMDLTTSTSGSSYRNGGEAYLLRLNSYNNDLEFRSYLGGGTGGIIRLRTHDGSGGSIRYWQMDEKGVTTHRSRSTVVKTHEFSYTGGAGGGTLNENLLSISGYSASSTAVVRIEYVGMYGLAGSYISQGIWLCSYRRANGGSAANALAQQTHNGGSNSASNVTMAWVGDNLRLTVGAFTGFTVHVTATVYNATINVLV